MGQAYLPPLIATAILGLLFLVYSLLTIFYEPIAINGLVVLYMIYMTYCLGWRRGAIISVLTVALSFFFLFEPAFRWKIPGGPLFLASSTIIVISLILFGELLRRTQLRYENRLLNKAHELAMHHQRTTSLIHDLKNPLTTIKLYSQMLSKRDRAGEAINQETDKLIVLVERLLDFAKLAEGKFRITKEHFSVTDLLKQRIAAMQGIDPDHVYTLDISTKDCKMYADKICVDRIIINLLTNASKYSPKGSTITTRCTQNSRNTILSVRDHGRGIPKNLHTDLFKPFVQGNTGKHGLGLGLYITKELVDLHKGHIRFTTSIHGTKFIVFFPHST